MSHPTRAEGLVNIYILKQEQQPQCGTCQTHLTVKYLFMECRFLAHTRNLKANNMKEMFENVNMEDILSFLREIELYHGYETNQYHTT